MLRFRIPFSQVSRLVQSRRTVVTTVASVPITPTLTVHQGSALRLVVDESFQDVHVSIETKWNDFVESWSNLDEELASHVQCTAADNGISFTFGKDLANRSSNLAIKLFVPEHFDVSVKGPKMNLSLHNKLLGNLLIMVPDGELSIDKVKGPEIGIFAGDAKLKVNKVLEGNVSIRCKSMVGKMINGDSISIATSESLQVEAMYGSDAVVRAGTNVDLGLFRGQLQCEVEGDANIRGIDGRIAIQSHSGNVHLHVNSLTNGNASNNSGAADQDADGTHTIFAKKGNISCHLDPEAKINCYCEGNKTSKSVSIVSDAFESDYIQDSSALGRFTGVSSATKRPVFENGRGGGVGKIDLKGAEMQGYYKGGSVTGSSEYTEESQAETDSVSTLVAIAPEGTVALKTMSWIEIIKAKHGFA